MILRFGSKHEIRYTRRCVRSAIPALLLTVFVGCVSTPMPQGDLPAIEPVAARFEQSRPGIAIEEQIEVSEELRSDFATAVDFLERGRYDEAIALLQRVITEAPGLTAPHVDIAVAYEQADESDKAEQHLKAALELIPGHPVASNVYGLLLRKSGRFTEARAVFEASLNLFPEYLPARRNFGILCELYLGDPVTALKQYRIYSAAVPGDEKVKIWIASLHQQLDSAQ